MRREWRGASGRALLAAFVVVASIAALPSASTGMAAVKITIDTVALELPISVSGASQDASWRAIVTLQTATGTTVRRWAAPVTPVSWSARFPLGDLHSGEYRAIVVASDGVSSVTGHSGWIIVRRPAVAQVVQSVKHAGRHVALTFDDGLDPAAADRIFATLRTTHTPATLFLNASAYRRSPRLVRAVQRLLRSGLVTLGNHTADHTWLTRVSSASIRWQIRSDERYTQRTFGRSSLPFFRPPYGAWNARVRRIAGELGYTDFVLWSVDPSDYRAPPPTRVIASAMAQVSPGGIILMHVNATTASTLPTILRRLHARGYAVVPLWTLLHPQETVKKGP